MLITTPKGYIADLKDELNYGDYLAIKEASMSGVSISGTGDPSVGGAAIMAANRKAAELAIRAITTPDGVAVSLLDLPMADGRMIEEAVNALTAEATPEKKD